MQRGRPAQASYPVHVPYTRGRWTSIHRTSNCGSPTVTWSSAPGAARARSLFDRAVTPHVDQLRYRYVYLEELMLDIPETRQVFERWMQWEPGDEAWQAYVEFEQRCGELDRASAIYERWAAAGPSPCIWMK